ncbi:Na+/H+ antiporter NhaC family protein, partial [Balneolaceae bacterium ANBcel3]|nr:Na+/H+ antiporter NhaC family protein [Balneolaceae bacterium ANBcel3]
MLLIVFVLSLLFVIQQDTLVTDPSGWGIQIEEASHSDTLVTDDEDDCASFSFSDLQDDEPVPLCGEVEVFENGENDVLFQDYGKETEADSPSNVVYEQIEPVLPDTSGAAETRSGTTGGISGSWLSLLPPVVAIAIALFFRQVYFALFIGIWMGAWLASGMGLQQVFISFFTTVSHYIIPSVASPDHISILVFILMIGAMVGLIGANGGTRGVVDAVTRLVTTRRRARVTTTAMGYVVFFDDYANTMIVGNTMRAVTDRFRISRAKLAYLVDSTAAPVAIIALISTWIGAVAGYILEASNGIEELEGASYMIFLHSLPYNFYAFFAVVFVMIIAVSGRDFGPMYSAEQKALNGKDESPLDDPPPEDAQEASDELPSKSKKRG